MYHGPSHQHFCKNPGHREVEDAVKVHAVDQSFP